jgi:hypothetical protein
MLDEGAPSVTYRTNETGLSTVTRESPVAVLGLGAPLWPTLQRNFLLGVILLKRATCIDNPEQATTVPCAVVLIRECRSNTQREKNDEATN